MNKRKEAADKKGVALFSVQSDREFVKRKFSQAFDERLVRAEKLSFARRQWGDEEMESVGAVLQHCKVLKELSLHNNKIGNLGALRISKALHTMTNLVKLDLSDNAIGDDGAKSIMQHMSNMTRLEVLNFKGNSIGAEG